jgi:precorrin-3B synthase
MTAADCALPPFSGCPAGTEAVPARDGLLFRLIVPGGVLSAGQLVRLSAAAEREGNGLVEITNRANLQIRGLRAPTLPRLVDALTRDGLLPAGFPGRRREIGRAHV